MEPLLRALVKSLAAVAGWALLALLALYRALVSPALWALTGSGCRFQPSCSEYAAACVRQLGPVRGSWRALGRILRCHPLARGGLDLPPERQEVPALMQRSSETGR